MAVYHYEIPCITIERWKGLSNMETFVSLLNYRLFHLSKWTLDVLNLINSDKKDNHNPNRKEYVRPVTMAVRPEASTP
jgi:hypothetical protein